MLAFTETAVAVIRDLTADPELPQGCGLRIASADDASGDLTVSLDPGPMPGDEVIDLSGARVFLEAEASELLSAHTLDAQQTDEGAGFFLVDPAA